MRFPNRIEIAKRICNLVSSWDPGSRILPADIACTDIWDEDEEKLYLKLTHRQTSQYLSFTIGEIYDIALVLTIAPEHATITSCIKNLNSWEQYQEVIIGFDANIIRRELMQRHNEDEHHTPFARAQE